MAYKDVLDDVIKCIRLEKPGRMPAIALSEEFDVGQAGITYEEYSCDAGKVAQVHIKALHERDFDWACVYIDDCIEFEPLGVKTTGMVNVPKSATRYVPATRETFDLLRQPNPYCDGRMPVLTEAISKIRSEFGNSVMICGRTPAPFSAASLLYGIEDAMCLMYDDPRLLQDTMRFLVELELGYARAQLAAGAHALWVGDCCASSRFISLSHFNKFVLDITASFISELKRLGAITIYFAAEKDTSYILAAAGLGADIIGVSENADLAECLKVIQGRVCLMGNLDPINILQDGSPDDIRVEIKKISDNTSGCGGYLFNTGEGVTRDTHQENMRALADAIRSWNLL